MGARYNVSRAAIAVSTTADTLTITAPATRSLKIWAIRAQNTTTAATGCVILVQRSTAGTTPTAITPAPLHPDYAAATFTAASTWTTTPTLTANTILARLNQTASGAFEPRVFPPGQEIDVPASGQISFRAETGTNVVAFDVLVEQV